MGLLRKLLCTAYINNHHDLSSRISKRAHALFLLFFLHWCLLDKHCKNACAEMKIILFLSKFICLAYLAMDIVTEQLRIHTFFEQNIRFVLGQFQAISKLLQYQEEWRLTAITLLRQSHVKPPSRIFLSWCSCSITGWYNAMQGKCCLPSSAYTSSQMLLIGKCSRGWWRKTMISFC